MLGVCWRKSKCGAIMSACVLACTSFAFAKGSTVSVLICPTLFIHNPCCHETVNVSTWEIFVSRVSPVRWPNCPGPILPTFAFLQWCAHKTKRWTKRKLKPYTSPHYGILLAVHWYAATFFLVVSFLVGLRAGFFFDLSILITSLILFSSLRLSSRAQHHQ